MISRSFNQFFKLAYQMSKNKKIPDDPDLQNIGVPPEAIQQVNQIQQKIVMESIATKKQIDNDRKKNIKWKKKQQTEPAKNQNKQKKWLKNQRNQNSQNVQNIKNEGSENVKNEKQKNQKKFIKPQLFKNNKKFFIDSLQPKNKVQKDIQTSQIKEIQSNISAILNNFKSQNLDQIKNNFQKIRTHKQSKQQFQIIFQELAQQDISKSVQLLKTINFKQVQSSSKLIQNLLMKCAQKNQFKTIKQILEIFQSSQAFKKIKSTQFLQILFLNQIQGKIDFLTGQNSLKISTNNQIFVTKILIAYRFLHSIRKGTNKQDKYLQNIVMPSWFLKVAQIVERYRFGKMQFEFLLTQLLSNHVDLIPSWFYESQLFTKLLRYNYFGKQNKLKKLLDILFVHLPKFKFKQFYMNFVHELMIYRSDNGKPAFYVSQQLKNRYQNSLNNKNKNEILLWLLIAQDSNQSKIISQYMEKHTKLFVNQGVTSEYLASIQQLILNNYNRVTQAQQFQKILQKLQRSGVSKLIKFKASIKLGNLTGAYKLFNETYIKPVAIERQRKNIQFVLKTKLGDKSKSFLANKDINTFVQELSPQYLWSLHKKSEDISSMLSDYIPDDKFSFWDSVQKKQRFDQIVRLKYKGKLDEFRQPANDIEKDGFNLNEYIQTELKQLEEEDKLAYQKQKQLIRFKIKVDSLNDLIRVKPDKFVYQKLKEFQEQLSEQSLNVIQSFGIKDFDIIEYGWTQFNQRFQKMKVFNNIPKDQTALINLQIDENNSKKRKNKIYSSQKIQQLLIKCPDDFKEASRIVHLAPQLLVQNIILWGVYTKQPMAIYMGQKLAMITGQKISHQIALKVSNLLSYRRVISQDFVTKCKQSLQVVGKINRQNIYDMDKDYHHILYRQQFSEQARKYCQQKVGSEKIQELLFVNPLINSWQQQPKFFIDSILERKNVQI